MEDTEEKTETDDTLIEIAELAESFGLRVPEINYDYSNLEENCYLD